MAFTKELDEENTERSTLGLATIAGSVFDPPVSGIVISAIAGPSNEIEHHRMNKFKGFIRRFNLDQLSWICSILFQL